MRWFIGMRQLRKLGILGMNCRNIDFIGRYNPRNLYPLVDDKLKTKYLARRHGIPVPGLRFVVREQYKIRNIERLLNRFGGFCIKPAKGSGGRGILVIKERSQEHFVKSSGVKLTIGDIKRHMSNILAGLYSLAGTPDVVIIEELIDFDDRFEGFSHEGIPDIRIIVFQGYPVMAMLRLATHESDGKANLHQGAVGVGLDIATGRCLNAVQYSKPLSAHPDTGKVFDQIQIPDWPGILHLASRCCEMTGLGYLGTDIVLDKKRGPLLLELNARPGLAIQMANGHGILPRLRQIEKLGRKHATPQERVRYAMKAFGNPQIGAEALIPTQMPEQTSIVPS
jgi:alpha-L-glutamate ligase-like protein